MASGGFAGSPTSPFLTRLSNFLARKSGFLKTNPNNPSTIVPGTSITQPIVAQGNTIIPSQFSFQQNQPFTGQTITSPTQTIVPGNQSMTIVPGGFNNPSGQTIVNSGILQNNNQLNEQNPEDSLQATNQNLLRRAFSAALEDISTQKVPQEHQRFSTPTVRDFVTQNEDRVRQELQASELARFRRMQSSDYQSNQLANLALSAQYDKTLADINRQIQENIYNQLNKRFEDMKAIKDFNVAVENYQIDMRNKERMAEALRKQQRQEKWGSIITDALFGDPVDEVQNKETIEKYLEAETKIRSAQQLKAKIEEMAKQKQEIDEKYISKLAELKTKYENETDQDKKTQLKTEYETELARYEAEKRKIEEDYERFKEQELPLYQLIISRQNQRRANRFINPTGIGLTTRKFSKGGKTSALDFISETNKTKTKKEKNKKEEIWSFLLEKAKKELEENLKRRERYDKLRLKIIEKLIKLDK